MNDGEAQNEPSDRNIGREKSLKKVMDWVLCYLGVYWYLLLLSGGIFRSLLTYSGP